MVGLAACGDNFETRDCATGTKPDPTGANQCVPDGSVLCGDGTTYDMASGKCVAGGQCPKGQVLVNGSCTADVVVDAEESAEDNDTTGAGEIVLPDVGAPGYVIHGCISPRDSGTTADTDPWFVTVTKPTLLDVTADGVGGLAAGFVAIPASKELQPLVDAGWQRFGINLVDDTSARQLLLPAAGTYAIVMSDSRQLFLTGAVAGSPTACYYTTVTQLAIPAATPLTAASTMGTIGTEVQFFSLTPQEGDLVDATNTMATSQANQAVVILRDNDYGNSASHSIDSSGTDVPAETLVGGLKASDSVVIAVDTEYNFALVPQDFTLSINQFHAQQLPTDGQITTTEDPVFFTFAYFDVANDGDVVNFDLTFADDAFIRISDANLGTIANIGDIGLTFNDTLHFPKAGRYYLLLFHQGLNPGDTSVTTSKLTFITPSAIAVGVPITNHALDAVGASYFTLDPTAQNWITLNAAATNFGGNVDVTIYPIDGAGRFDSEILSVHDYSFNPNGSQTFGRITFGDPTKYVVRVQDASGTPAASPTFNLSVAVQVFTNLGTVTETTPASKTGEDLGGTGKKKFYFVRGTPGDNLTVTVHPTAGVFVPSVTWLDIDQGTRASAAAAAGVNAVLSASVGTKGFAAFVITGTGATTTYDVSVSESAPVDYIQNPSSAVFTEICDPSTELTLSSGLSDPVTPPFAFSLFGDTVGDFTVSELGWLAFGAVTDEGFTNQPIPTEGAPDGIIAPYWSGDLFTFDTCETSDADTVTIEWDGVDFATFNDFQFEVVLHSDNSVDFIYGPDHLIDGVNGTIGLENIWGTFGRQTGFNTAGSVKANMSLSYTPLP